MLRRTLVVILFTGVFVGAACAAPTATPLTTQPAGQRAPQGPPVAAANEITLIRSPSCGCCGGHAEHLAEEGYGVHSVIVDTWAEVKDARQIPVEMRSCHTSLVSRYFVEGHVPAAAIDQLLRERPDIDGIALPGMPAGSPGMTGVAEGPLTVFAIKGGIVSGVFGEFAGD